MSTCDQPVRFLSLTGPADAPDAGAEAEAIFRAVDVATARFSDLARIRYLYSAFSEVAELTAVRQAYVPPRVPDGNHTAATGVITGGTGSAPRLTAQAVIAPGKRRIQPPSLWSEVGGRVIPVSHGTAVDGVLFVSGQVPYDRDAQLVGETSSAQVEQALTNLNAVLVEAGARRSQVLGFTVYHVSDDAAHDRAARAHFDHCVAGWSREPAPVTWVPVQQLFQPGLMIEIEATVSLIGAPWRSGRQPADAPGPGVGASSADRWAYGTATVAWDSSGDLVLEGCERLLMALAACGVPSEAASLVTAWCPDRTALHRVAAECEPRLPGAVVTAAPYATPAGAAPLLILEALVAGG